MTSNQPSFSERIAIMREVAADVLAEVERMEAAEQRFAAQRAERATQKTQKASK